MSRWKTLRFLVWKPMSGANDTENDTELGENVPTAVSAGIESMFLWDLARSHQSPRLASGHQFIIGTSVRPNRLARPDFFLTSFFAIVLKTAGLPPDIILRQSFSTITSQIRLSSDFFPTSYFAIVPDSSKLHLQLMKQLVFGTY